MVSGGDNHDARRTNDQRPGRLQLATAGVAGPLAVDDAPASIGRLSSLPGGPVNEKRLMLAAMQANVPSVGHADA